MKQLFFYCILSLAFTLGYAKENHNPQLFTPSVHFMYNKGQVVDASGKPRTDVDFVLRKGNVKVLVGCGRLEYHMNGGAAPLIMQLQGIAPVKALAEGRSSYMEHYYGDGAVVEDIPSAERICYKGIYPGIDWVLYLDGNQLEHEFVLQPMADAAAIQWVYTGHKGVSVQASGALHITHAVGVLKEAVPIHIGANGQRWEGGLS
jgi:hypothetical protein